MSNPTMSDDYIWIVTDEAGGSPPAQQPVRGPMRDGSRDGSRGDTSRDWSLQPSPYETSPERISKGGGASKAGRIPVPAAKLEQGLKQFLAVMGRALRQGMESAGDGLGMELEEVELTVEVNGEGEVSLMGSGVKAGSKGSMTLKFKKKGA